MHKLTKGRTVFVQKGIITTIFVLLFLVNVSLGCQTAFAGVATQSVSPLVESKWLADNLGNKALRIIFVGFILEDDKEKYDQKHIPGSVYLGAGSLMDALGDGSSPPDKAKFETLMSELGINDFDHVVVYGSSGGNPFISAAFWLFDYFGHKQVSYLNGGMAKWMKEGRQTTGEASKVVPAKHKGVSDESIRADANYVLKNIKNDKVVLVDSRSPDEFVGKEDRNTRKGHIPGAINLNFYTTNLNDDETFKSVEDLKAVYEAKGVTKDKEIITYCEAGLRAAHTYFVLKYLLDYPNVKNYVGSWGEWGNRLDPEKYPLEK